MMLVNSSVRRHAVDRVKMVGENEAVARLV